MLALKTIVDKELASSPPTVQAEQDQTPDTPAPDGQSDSEEKENSNKDDSEEQEDEPILDKFLKENKDKKVIEDWLKNI